MRPAIVVLFTAFAVLQAPTAQAVRYVYVANILSGTVSQIDPGTHTVVATIPVLPEPLGLAADANELYVAGVAASEVQMVDVRSHQPVGSLDFAAPFGTHPSSLFLSAGCPVPGPCGEVLLSGDSDELGGFYCAGPASGCGIEDDSHLLTEIAPCGRPLGGAQIDGGFLHFAVSCNATSNVIVRHYAQGFSVPVDPGPTTVVFDTIAGFNVVFVASDSGAVTALDADTGAIISRTTGLSDPTGLASGNFELYVGEAGSDTVRVYSEVPPYPLLGTIPVGRKPYAMVLAGTELYVTNFTDGTVSVVDTTTRTVVATIPVGFQPTMVIVGPDITPPNGTFWLNVNDNVFPPAMSGQATYTGGPAPFLAANPVTITGTLTGFTSGPPDSGTSASTQTAAAGPSALFADMPSGTFVCSAAGCNSGDPVSFVGPATFSGTVAGALPPDSVYTVDGSASLVPTIPGVPSCNPPQLGHRCFQGRFGVNAFPRTNTPPSSTPGAPVTVTGETTYFNPISGLVVPVTMSVTFEGGVTAGGVTTFATFSNAAGAIPSNFATSVDGSPAAFTDVVTTASYAGPITVCSSFPDVDHDGLIDHAGISVCSLHLLHDEGGTFRDRTMALSDLACPLHPVTPCAGAVAPCIDPGTSQICGRVSSFSFFTTAIAVGDTDGDGVADPYDPCTRQGPGQTASKARLVAKQLDLTRGLQDVVWKGSFVPPVGTPVEPATTGVHVQIDEHGGNQPSVAVDLPEGFIGQSPSTPCDARDGWAVKTTGAYPVFIYKNYSGFIDGTCAQPAQGIKKIVVRDRRTTPKGDVQFIVTGKDIPFFDPVTDAEDVVASFALATQPGPGAASPAAMAGQCAEFRWTQPIPAVSPAPFCKLTPSGGPFVKQTCATP